MSKRLDTYDARIELGLPVTLEGTVIAHDDDSIEIPAAETLIAAVAVTRALIPLRLVGAELRFLRTALDLSQAEFAEAIDCGDKTVVSRWENDRTALGGFTEKVIRQLVVDDLGEKATGVPVAKGVIPRMKILAREGNDASPLPMTFRFNADAAPSGHYAPAEHAA